MYLIVIFFNFKLYELRLRLDYGLDFSITYRHQPSLRLLLLVVSVIVYMVIIIGYYLNRRLNVLNIVYHQNTISQILRKSVVKVMSMNPDLTIKINVPRLLDIPKVWFINL